MKHQGPEAVAERLALYEELLRSWSLRFDLISPSDRSRIRERHIEDSLRALPIVVGAPPGPAIDVGSGAGLPGVPLAVATDRHWRLLEPRRKRAAFLEEVVRELELANCEVVTMTAQEAATHPEMASAHAVATARALAGPAQAGELCLPLVSPRGTCVIFIGKDAEKPAKSAEIVPGLITLTRDDGPTG